MENIYAAMLLHKAGKEINEQSVTSVLQAAGVTVDPVQVKALVASLSEVNIDDAIKSAPTMMAGPAAAPAGAAPAAEQKAAAAAPEDKKKKAEEEKAKEEAALEGLGALFG